MPSSGAKAFWRAAGFLVFTVISVSIVQLAGVCQIGTESRNQLEGLSLYLQTKFRGHAVWALNAAYFDFLLHYIEAELRDKYQYAYGHGDKYSLSGGVSG